MPRNCVACFLVVALVPSALAQAPKPIRLWLTPAKPPTPALRYQLLPDARVATSGNAADIYHKAVDWLAKNPLGSAAEGLSDLATTPLNQFPKDNVRKELAAYQEVFQLLDKASCCDYCEWGIAERLRKDGIGALLPELQPMRQCAQLLAVKARLEMAEGHPDQALATLRTGFALARNTGQTETLIAFLVGVASATQMENQLDQLVSLPDAPNLYYALADLPSPLIDMRKSIESERLWIAGTFPGLAEVAANRDAGNLPEKDLKTFSKLVDGLRNERLGYAGRLYMGWNILQKHEIAKQALIDAGRPRDKVEAMPPLQVAMLHALLEYDAALDNIIIAQKRPYWEWTDPDNYVNKKYLKDRWKYYDTAAIPLAPLVLPAIQRVVFARARTDRKIALLRTIEAIRLYAANHDGTLPGTLGAIREVPLPLDPVTGKSFQYQLDGDLAKLSAPVPAGQTPNLGNTVVYEMKVRK
jgi:hypothetical protein